jgi:hypothetical protein
MTEIHIMARRCQPFTPNEFVMSRRLANNENKTRNFSR